ncbi:pseudouridylate synthase transporter [Micractinium conductrix]|uniref:tRNA pseudouridine(55) synthase n=1 Tax=Micractinium conductrix TaxID=554055 RepID=A0A2P6VAT2_9CHLO|nr:pseudouridylate synthase transporter [Micractinium conductrix]|eukprot:PSC71200.1 pseudouridylate synthase transporter [Micractinium conductrix]
MTAEASRLAKRHRLGQAAVSDGAPQQMAAPAPAAVAEAEAVAAAAPSNAQPAKKAKQVVMPTPVPPPAIPADPAAWDNAVLLVDKPKDWTSFDVCGKLRGTLAALLRKKNREVKVGHAGTLDPMATGLLIVCVGRGTKAVDAFMAMHKEYSGTLRLGEGTPSYDAETPVEEALPWEHITDEQLLAARDGLVGQIEQLPPMYSAIQVGGQKLCNAARKGKEIERQPRAVTVDRFDVWRDAADAQSVHFRVVCSKGTYIRSLAHDLGRAVNSAAHLTALRREAIGEYSVGAAWQVADLAAQVAAQRQQRKEADAAAAQPGYAGAAAEAAQGAATAADTAPGSAKQTAAAPDAAR